MAADILSENLSLLLNRSLKALSTNRADPCEVRGFPVSHRSLFSSIFNIRQLQQRKLLRYFFPRPDVWPAPPPWRLPGLLLRSVRNTAAIWPGSAREKNYITSAHLEGLRGSGLTLPPAPFLTFNSRKFKNVWKNRHGESLIVGQGPVWAGETRGHNSDMLHHQPIKLTG